MRRRLRDSQLPAPMLTGSSLAPCLWLVPQAVAEKCRQYGAGGAKVVLLDVLAFSTHVGIANDVVREFGKVDILVRWQRVSPLRPLPLCTDNAPSCMMHP